MKKLIYSAFALATVGFSCLTTAIAQPSRLLAKSTRVYSGSAFALADTTAYYYASASHGGDPHHTLKYDSLIMWQWTGSSLDTALTAKQHINSADLIDTAYANYRLSSATGMHGLYLYILEYNANRTARSYNCLHDTSTLGWINLWRRSYFYNSCGTVSQDVMQSGGGASGWTNAYTRKYTYRNVPNPYEQNDFDYIQGTHFATNEYDFSFPVDSCYDSILILRWNGTSFGDDTAKYKYQLDGSGNIIVKTLYKRNTSGSWVPDSQCTYASFTSFHKPLDEIDQVWNGSAWDNYRQYIYTYNTYGQVTSQLANTWSGSAWTAGPTLRYYYYGPYTPPTVAENITDRNGSVTVFPNPASDNLIISINLNKEQPMEIVVSNLLGKVVQSNQVTACRNYKQTINTSALAAGTYIVQVTTPHEKLVRRFLVEH